MTVPGGIGAFLGAVVLSSLSAEVAAPAIAVFLSGLGAYILIRFGTRAFPPPRPSHRKLPALSLLGASVALGASAGLLVSLSLTEVNLAWVGALLCGGLIAAPIAAWLVKQLPPRILGSAVGGVILLTNPRTFGEAVGVEGGVLAAGYVVLAAVAGFCVWSALMIERRERRLASMPGVAVL